MNGYSILYMELNVEKVQRQLDQIDKTFGWLAGQISVARSHMKYWVDHKSPAGAKPIAEFFGLEEKDLIK